MSEPKETQFKVGDTVLVDGTRLATVTRASWHSSGIGMYYVKGPDISQWQFDCDLIKAPPVVTMADLFAQIEKLSASVEKLVTNVERLTLEIKYMPGGTGYTEAETSFQTQVIETIKTQEQ